MPGCTLLNLEGCSHKERLFAMILVLSSLKLQFMFTGLPVVLARAQIVSIVLYRDQFCKFSRLNPDTRCGLRVQMVGDQCRLETNCYQLEK